MKVFIRKPNINFYPGIIVDKDTDIEFEKDGVKQTIKDLVLHSVTRVSGEGYESVNDTVIVLCEGDVLLFEGDGRGYIKPVEGFVTIPDAIKELNCIKDIGENNDVH